MEETLTKEKLFGRINLGTVKLEDLGESTAREYSLGTFISIEPLFVGYEELNCKLKTSAGDFVVKIFSKDKDLYAISTNVTSLHEYGAGGIPVPQLYRNKEGNYLSRINDEVETYFIVMKFIDGKNFTAVAPTLEDKKAIVRILSNIHKLNYEIDAAYDSWLTINLKDEFEKRNSVLDSYSLTLLDPVVNAFASINFDGCEKTIVHFDLHRENVLVDNSKQYFILDLASTAFNYKVVDLATYLALFCTEVELSATENVEIYNEVITEYLRAHTLSEVERRHLPVLIQSTFASNLLLSESIKKLGIDENPVQTVYYNSIALSGLEMFRNFTMKFPAFD